MHVSPPINLTPQEQILVKGELDTDPTGLGYKRVDGNWKSNEEIAALLSMKTMVPNKEAQPNIPAPLNKNQFLGILLPFINSVSDEALIRVSDAVDEDDRASIGMWLTIALARTWIDQAAHDQLVALLGATVPDPNWQPQVPGQSALERVLKRSTGISPQEVGQILILSV